MIPVGIRCVLDMVWFGIQTYFGALFLDIVFQCVFGYDISPYHRIQIASLHMADIPGPTCTIRFQNHLEPLQDL